MEKLISVIVPIYNVEKYLMQCIDSIINQTYKNLEILLIDDGSKDNSGKICDEYAQKDKRIKVVHKENGGVSSARNTGLNMAKGDYIGFIDSDDFIDENLYSVLMKNIEEEMIDIVQFEGYAYGKNKKNVDIGRNSFYGIIEDRTQALIGTLNGMIHWSACLKIYSAKLLKNIRFNEELRVGEDAMFAVKCSDLAQKIKLISYKGYYYCYRENSVTNNPLNEKQYDIFNVIDKWKEEYKQEIELFPYIIKAELIYHKSYIRRILQYRIYKNRLKEHREKILRYKDYIYNCAVFKQKDKNFIVALRFAPHLLYFCIWLYTKIKN